MDRKTCGAKEGATYIGVHIDTFYRMLEHGQIRHRRIKGKGLGRRPRYLITFKALDEYLDGNDKPEVQERPGLRLAGRR